MNSVEQARARKRGAMPSFGGAPPPADVRGKVPSPPPSVVQKRPSLVESASGTPPDGSTLQRSHSMGRKALPNIPVGAVSASPKAGRIAQQLSASIRPQRSPLTEGSTDDDADDIGATLRRMDGAATPTDEMDALSGEEYQLATQTFGNRITPEFLRSRTGFEDLHLVTSTELIVDTRRTAGADGIGEWMPRLVELRLNHSHVQAFRDLGSKFLALQILHLNNAHVSDIRGIAACSRLKELYIAFNSLRQLSDLCALEHLQVLDAEGNRVEDIAEVECLGNIASLESLCLSGNPAEVAMGSDRFRATVAQCIPQLKRLDDTPLVAAPAAAPAQRRHADPMHQDLMRELYLVQDSIRTNVSMDRGLEGCIEAQHRKLYSRQSTSCSGARRRTPASQSTPRSTERHRATDGARAMVNSAPEVRSPKKKPTLTPPDSSSATLTPSAEDGPAQSFLNRNVLQRAASNATRTPPGGSGGTRDARDGGAASILTSGGAMFSGSLAQSLRRRLPSLGGKVPSAALNDETLNQIKADVAGGQSPSAAPMRTLREHELVQRLSQLKTAHEEGKELQPNDAAALERLLDELGLEFDMECVGGNDESELEAFKREEFARHLQDERPQFLDRYKENRAKDSASSDEDAHRPATEIEGNDDDRLTDAEMIREIAKLKQRTLRETTGSLIEDPQQYESLQMSDLGANVDDVL